MSLYLLDTDTITLAQFGHAAVVAQLGKQADTDIALPVMSLQEQMRGWLEQLTPQPALAGQRMSPKKARLRFYSDGTGPSREKSHIFNELWDFSF